MNETWRTVFGHDEAYPEQEDGIETALDTASDGGYLIVEGACGTGKTMLALTAGIDLVRDPESPFERVVVLTSVKQQLRQFETDLQTINDNLPSDWRPISGLTLVGKADVCPYSREGLAGIDDRTVYDRCERLRERTRDLAEETMPASLAAEARSQQTGLAGSDATAARYIETAGEMAPYAPSLPSEATATGDVEFCPFYAQYLADLPADADGSGDDRIEAVPFDVTDAGLIDPENLVARSVAAGTCPHSMLGALLGEVEVVVGNYYHAFEPTTVATFTGALLDESTFLVCDEAHMLEPRVRELVSNGVTAHTLNRTTAELSRVIQPVELAEGAGQPAESTAAAAATVRSHLANTDISLDDVRHLRSFIEELRGEIDQRITSHLDHDHPGWRTALADLPDAELPLRDPEEPATDELTSWATEAGYTDRVWVQADAIGTIVADILDDLDADEPEPTEGSDDVQRAAPAVGRFLGAWHRADHVEFFREIELERTWNESQPGDAWQRAYSARLALHNCLPSETIGDRLAEFGGGILMSATLEPIETFREVAGLDHLATTRPVAERRYGLSFPTENRESFAVAAPKFTYAERGAPGEDTQTRQVYADVLCQVAGRPGNVLVGMPSYAEAEWAASVLRNRLSKEVLVDESSGDAATESLKVDFFAGEGKVLVTSLRGTLTEGVDYRGDRLSAAVVCGVPIVNTASPRIRAVRTAYDRAFGDGFRYALAVPAVRKARQAIGRVIRGPDEEGIRVLVDERYATDRWDSVRDLLPPHEREEFTRVSPDMLSLGLDRFRG